MKAVFEEYGEDEMPVFDTKREYEFVKQKNYKASKLKEMGAALMSVVLRDSQTQEEYLLTGSFIGGADDMKDFMIDIECVFKFAEPGKPDGSIPMKLDKKVGLVVKASYVVYVHTQVV